MLTKQDLRRLVTASPNWPRVVAGFRTDATHQGINLWAPLLGDGNLSVLRELHDYSRALALLDAHERTARGGRRYRRIVFSRLEFEWLADHPPLRLLPTGGGQVWLPSGGVSSGVNDRHALMSRAAAQTYFTRWELLMSPRLFDLIPERVVLRDGPELLLEAALRAAKLRTRYFPSTMTLGCCGRRSRALGRCFGNTVCITRSMRFVRGGTRLVTAKYFDELKFAERHLAALACPGAHFAAVGGAAMRRQSHRAAHHREPAVVIALPSPTLSRWHPDPCVSADTAACNNGTAHSSGRAARARAGWDGVRRFTWPAYTTFVRPVPFSDAEERAAAVATRRALLDSGAGQAALRTLQQLAERSVGQTPARGGREGAAAGGSAERAPLEPSLQRSASEDPARLAESLSPCPLLPRHWWPAGAVRGFCQETRAEGDCAAGAMGNFPVFEQRGMFRGELLSIGECAKLCAQCSRCRYISVAVSPDVVDCSWYHSCDLTQTRELPHTNFVSMSLASAQAYGALCRERFGEAAC